MSIPGIARRRPLAALTTMLFFLGYLTLAGFEAFGGVLLKLFELTCALWRQAAFRARRLTR
jgi:hypothetical protein